MITLSDVIVKGAFTSLWNCLYLLQSKSIITLSSFESSLCINIIGTSTSASIAARKMLLLEENVPMDCQLVRTRILH